MSFLEFTQLMNMADNLLKNAREGKELSDGIESENQEEVNADILRRTADLVKTSKIEGRGSKKERFWMQWRGKTSAWLLRVELWARGIDQGDPDGPLTRFLVRPVFNAVTQYKQARREPLQSLLDILSPQRDVLSTRRRIEAHELGANGWVFSTKGELIAALLHTGNASNLKKLLLGGQRNVAGTKEKSIWGTLNEETGKLDTSRWDAFIERMFDEGVLTKADMDMVQGVWDIFETTKEQAQRAHKEMYDYFFEEIEATPIETRFGTYRGGYVPAIADPMMEPQAAKNLEEDLLNTQQNASMFPGAEEGFTKARTEVTLALELDLAMLPAHLDRVMKFAYLGPTIRRAARWVNTRSFRDTIGQFDGEVVNAAIIPWLQRTVSQRITQPSTHPQGDRMLTFLNTAVGLQAMTGNLLNAAQQLTGIISAATIISPRFLIPELTHLTKNGQAMRKYISERSPFMQNRFNDSVRDITSNIEDILSDTTPFKKAQAFAKRYGYFAQQQMQNMNDAVVWAAAEQQAISRGLYEKVFKKFEHLGVDEAHTLADKAVVEYADAVVRDTQTPMNPEDVSRIEATNAFARLFVKFYSYFNNMYNLNRTQYQIITREVGWQGKPGRLFYLYLMGIAGPAVIAKGIMMAGRGDFDIDDEDEIPYVLFELFGLSQIEMVAGFIPGGGGLAARIYGGFTPEFYDDRMSFSPVLSFVDTAISGGLNIASVVGDDKDINYSRLLKNGLSVIGVTTGLPTNWFSKPTSYLLKVAEGDSTPRNIVDIAQGFLSGRDGTEN